MQIDISDLKWLNLGDKEWYFVRTAKTSLTSTVNPWITVKMVTISMLLHVAINKILQIVKVSKQQETIEKFRVSIFTYLAGDLTYFRYSQIKI